MGAGFEIHHDLQASVQKASDLSITTSCTLRVNDDTFCVHDGIWRDCGLGLSQRSHTDEDIKRPQPWHAFIFENIWILWFYDNIIILTLNYHFKYIWTWIVYIINIEMCETAKCDIKWAHSQAAAARIWLHASRRRSVASPEIRRKATFALLKKLQENCDVCFLYDVCIIYIYILFLCHIATPNNVKTSHLHAPIGPALPTLCGCWSLFLYKLDMVRCWDQKVQHGN